MGRNFEVYRINEKDSIENLCNKFGIEKQEFLRLNPNFEACCGRLVLIKKKRCHIVQPGETFEVLEKKLGFSEKSLKEKINTTTVFIGQLIEL